MKKIMLTPLELALIVSLAMMLCAALFAAHRADQATQEAGFWKQQFTNTVIIRK